VIYAAGGLNANLLEKLTSEEWNATLTANLTGAFLASRASLNLLKRDGHLILIGAYTEKITLPRMGAYVAAKSGLESLVTVLQKENRKLKITLVRPPAVDTPFWQNVPFRLPASALQPQQVASAMIAHYVKGEVGELNL
jgi:NAD(P)-dependent dehydrogenase (short-subunit alcohol dehydrogenase family)